MKKSLLSTISFLLIASTSLGFTGCSREQGGAGESETETTAEMTAETTAETTAASTDSDDTPDGSYRYAYRYFSSEKVRPQRIMQQSISVLTGLEIPSQWMPVTPEGGVIAKVPDPETGLLKSYINIGSYNVLYEVDSDFVLDGTIYSQVNAAAAPWEGAETVEGDNYVIYRCPQELSERIYDVQLAALAFVRISPSYIAVYKMCGEQSDFDDFVGIIGSASRKYEFQYDYQAVNAAVKTMEEVSYNAEFVAAEAYADFSYESERELDTPIAVVGELTTRYFPTGFSNEYSSNVMGRSNIEESSVTLWEVESDYVFDERLSESPLTYSTLEPRPSYVIAVSGVNSYGYEYVVYQPDTGSDFYFMFIRLSENYIIRIVGSIEKDEMQHFVDTVHLK